MSAPVSRRSALKGALATGAAALIPLAVASRADGHADYPELTIIASDHHFEMEDRVPGGILRVVIDNQGAASHHVWFLRVNDDVSIESVEDALGSVDIGTVFATTTSFGGPMVGPGATASAIVDLPEGQYVVLCAIPDEQGVPHFLMGMQNRLEVSHPATTLAVPEGDQVIELMEMMFHGLEEHASAGSQIWKVVNAGQQVHELALVKLVPGLTARAFLELLASPPDESTGEGDPFTIIAGAAPMSPGSVNFIELDLEPGEYAALCFMPDAETGLPHVALGMAIPIVVE